MTESKHSSVNLPLAMLLSGMAGGMGWGIRGQYGHQTGAMIAGVLVGLTLMLLFARHLTALSGARAVAFLTLGVSIGGSMTYGQTIGLTQDNLLIGNEQALAWGLGGLFLKGGIWIGLAGLFLGMSLSSTHYQPAELALLLVSAVFLRLLGIELLNEPYLPDEQILPTIYFSEAWYWKPSGELTPRREVWGGLLLALVALTAYVRWVRGDRLGLRLAVVGFLGGGLGFSLGQCLQASHAWHPEWFDASWFAPIEPHVNWWNMMEITFGAVFASSLAWGLWFNKRLIRDEPPAAVVAKSCQLSGVQELLLGGVHVSALVAWTFADNASLGALAGMAYPMIVIPLVAVSAGRYWPYLVVFPIVLIPIAGKTLKQIAYHTQGVDMTSGWLLVVALPVLLACVAVPMFARAGLRSDSRYFASRALPGVAWMYFLLNFAFFEFPWPWQSWTGRTPSGVIFMVCVGSLTLAAVYYGQERFDGSVKARQRPLS